MIFSKIKSMFKQGFQGMWRNRGMGIASITSIAAVLVILGAVLILVLSVNSLVADTQEKLDEIDVFLEDELTQEEKDDIKEKIVNHKYVSSIEYMTKEDALEILKEDWEEDAFIFEGLEDENPLPESYIVRVSDVNNASKVVEDLKDVSGIERIRYHKEAIDKLLVFSEYIQTGGLILTVALIIISVFLISNTIKLTVHSRSREIEIMKYVGATNGYIKGPFILEGVLFGIFGAIIAFIIVYFGYGYLFDIINERLFAFLQIMLVQPTEIFKDIGIIFISIGSGIGAIGSIVSMKKFLNV